MAKPQTAPPQALLQGNRLFRFSVWAWEGQRDTWGKLKLPWRARPAAGRDTPVLLRKRIPGKGAHGFKDPGAPMAEKGAGGERLSIRGGSPLRRRRLSLVASWATREEKRWGKMLSRGGEPLTDGILRTGT